MRNSSLFLSVGLRNRQVLQVTFCRCAATASFFVMKGSGIWDRDHGAREPAEALKASSSTAPGDPSLTAAILALDRIDSAAGLHRLLYLRKPGAMACRTFTLDQFRRWLSHSNLSGAHLGFQIIGE
jgi:hypothetical protein